MNIRLTILALCIPLFLLLAGLNGALLIRQEMAEMQRALDNQAMAAAVTVAAFAAAAPDPVRHLTQPERVASVQRAVRGIPELQSLYLARPNVIMAQLIKTNGTVPQARIHAPERPMVLPVETNTAGQRIVAALAPASGDMFVVSEIDAEPLYARLAELKWLLVLMLTVAGLTGGLLAFLVARRVTRELAQNQAAIAAIAGGRPPPSAAELLIQETRDLGAAVRLMGTSLIAALERRRRVMAERDLHRNEADGVAAYHRASFAPVSRQIAGAAIEIRMLGAAPVGCFFALCQSSDGTCGTIVLGECAAREPVTALALACAARDFFEAHMYDAAPEEGIAMGGRAFDLTRVAWFGWTDAVMGTTQTLNTQTLALLDETSAARAAAYAGQSGTLTADAVMADLIALTPASGVLAVLSRSDPGEGRGDVRLDLENGRKSAYVEHLLHGG